MDDIIRRTFKVDNDGTRLTIIVENPSEVNNNHVYQMAQEFIAWSSSPRQLKLNFDTNSIQLTEAMIHADKPSSKKIYSIGLSVECDKEIQSHLYNIMQAGEKVNINLIKIPKSKPAEKTEGDGKDADSTGE